MAASAASAKAFAIIAGVGGGTGASVARKFARAYPVVLLARNPANYKSLVEEINSSGGSAVGISTDATSPESVKSAFSEIAKTHPNTPLAAAIYNVGGGFVRKPFLELTTKEWTGGWESNGMGAFYFSQAALPLLLKSTTASPHPPSLIFTGATASLRGSALCASFAAGKFALRALSQSLAREFGPQGVHVSHLVVDGGIATPGRVQAMDGETGDKVISPDAIADGYWYLHTQPKSAWTAEMDIRPFVEKW